MSGSPLHVMTFNVCGLPSSLLPLPERAVEFGRRVDESDVDVLNLQEVWFRRTFEAIRAGLPSFPHIAWRRALGGRPAGGLVTFSRHPLSTVEYSSYGGTRPTAGGLRFRVKRAVNGLLQGVLTARLTGRRTLIANTHLTANKDGDWSATSRYHDFQRAQLSVLHSVVRRRRTPDDDLVVLTGDFNLASNGALYPRIVADGAWRDPFAATDPATFHPEFLPPGNRPHRIDYLLVSGDERRFPISEPAVRFPEPVLTEERRMYLSDHLALSARIG